MLRLMREHATSWLIKVFLFAIVIVFIFWGGYSYTERQASRVAVVNGSYIGLREDQSMYNNLVEQMRRQFGRQFSSEYQRAGAEPVLHGGSRRHRSASIRASLPGTGRSHPRRGGSVRQL